MNRTLDQLVKEFTLLNEVGRTVTQQALIEGGSYTEALETKKGAFNGWVDSMSPEERATFDKWVGEGLNRAAVAMGYKNTYEQWKDFGQKLFSGLGMGLETGPIDWEAENPT